MSLYILNFILNNSNHGNSKNSCLSKVLIIRYVDGKLDEDYIKMPQKYNNDFDWLTEASLSRLVGKITIKPIVYCSTVEPLNN